MIALRRTSPAIALLIILPTRVCGQAELPAVEVVMEEYAQNAGDSSTDFPSDKYPNAGWVNATLLRPRQYSAARVDSILDGLEELASSSPSGTVRLRATVELTNAGDRAMRRGLGIVSRAGTVYRAAVETGDVSVQNMILGMMAIQQEEEEALSFLELVARQGDSAQASRALSTLGQMGSRGEEVLEQLDATDAVSDPLIRDALRRARGAQSPSTNE